MSLSFQSNPVSNLYSGFCGEIGSLGFVVSEPGRGKSTLCTLIGIHSLMRGDKILHVSLKSPQLHVRTRYEQSLEHLYTVEKTEETIELRKSIEQNRLVHSLLNQTCQAADIEDKAKLFDTLLEFKAQLIIVDGLQCEWTQETIQLWKDTATRMQCMIWITTDTDTIDKEQEHCIEIVEQDTLNIRNNTQTLTVQPQTLLCVEPSNRLSPSKVTLFSGGTVGAEAYFGEMAEAFGMREINFTFEGHEQKRTTGSNVLNDKELAVGATSLSYVSNVLNRNWKRTEKLQKVVQVLWHIVSHADQVFVVGTIQPDGTVHGGTGWSVELSKRWHKQTWVFDQTQGSWFHWNGQQWEQETPSITSKNIAGSGTRFLNHQGKEAIRDLFTRSFS